MSVAATVVTAEEREKVNETVNAVWFALPTRLWPNPQKVGEQHLKKWFSTLEQRHWEPTRYYHTFKHIQSLLRMHHVDQVAAAAKRFNDPRSDVMIDAAIFFHDAIYDPKAKDNEEKSAELWKQFSKEVPLLHPPEVEKVTKWILATKLHGKNEISLKDSDPDMALFLDFDLSILASTAEEYDEYTRAVRAEYGHLSDDEFKKGRKEVLNGFLSTERLFLTDPFHRIYEPRARENMKRELASLEGN